MDTDFLNIGLVLFIHSLFWASLNHKGFLTGTLLALPKIKHLLALSSNEKEISPELLDVEALRGDVFFMQMYKILILILVAVNCDSRQVYFFFINLLMMVLVVVGP